MAEGALKLLRSAKRYVPVSVKRPVKKLLPRRYHRVFDPDWHRRTIGNVPLWEELGRLQFTYLIEQGLRPEHYLLDVGCGPLRGGVHFIRYLEPGRYHGVDKNQDALEEARERELTPDEIAEKRPVLMAMSDFGFERLGQAFDYAIAQSVFTHLYLNEIVRCLVNIDRVLKPGGRFYATFFLNPDGKRNLDDIRQTDTVVTHFDRDFFHYDIATFEWACQGLGLSVDYLGDWKNPRNQQMLLFTKA
ncbi:MAG TPA: class I SAM-dependent methyltransferase [Gaiellaceae bacterium]